MTDGNDAWRRALRRPEISDDERDAVHRVVEAERKGWGRETSGNLPGVSSSTNVDLGAKRVPVTKDRPSADEAWRRALDAPDVVAVDPVRLRRHP